MSCIVHRTILINAICNPGEMLCATHCGRLTAVGIPRAIAAGAVCAVHKQHIQQQQRHFEPNLHTFKWCDCLQAPMQSIAGVVICSATSIFKSLHALVLGMLTLLLDKSTCKPIGCDPCDQGDQTFSFLFWKSCHDEATAHSTI
jgi:hypothetical protein